MTLKTEFEKIHKYCNVNHLDILNYLKKQESAGKEKKSAPSLKIKKKIAMRDIISGSFEQFEGKKNVSLDSIVQEVTSNAKREQVDLEIPFNCSLKGYISSIIYSLVKKKKKAFLKENKKINGEKDDKYILLKFPVDEKDITDLFRVSFDEESSGHIIGKLSSEYVKKTYPLNNGLLVDKSGKSYEIEGCKSWNGEEKFSIRNIYLSFIKKTLLKQLDDRGKQKNNLESEIMSVEKELNQMRESSEMVVKKIIAYKITGDRPSLMLFKNNKGRHYSNFSKINGIKIEKKKNELLIKWDSENVQKEAEQLIENIKTLKEKGDAKGKFLKGLRIEPKEARVSNQEHEKIKKQKKVLSDKREELEIKLRDFPENSEKTSLNYLGLEGPSFGSFLPLQALVKSYGFNFQSLIMEYLPREKQIMQSIINAYPEVFSGTEVMRRNIDSMILLDFVKDPSVKYNSGTNKVSFIKKELSLDEYYAFLKEVDESKDIEKTAREKFLPTQLIKALTNRHKGLFDIVFLDYYCGDKKIHEKVFHNLVNRMKDESILGITINLSSRLYWKNEKPDEILYKQFERLCKIEKLNILDFETAGPYKQKGSRDEMGFVVYHLKRK